MLDCQDKIGRVFFEGCMLMNAVTTIVNDEAVRMVY